ncbi:hypothetical protein WN48_02100 [Eufriesea mexicana]|nr:hypothetical protein WN48_02100 [Eufriesea mexicana]
MRIVTMTLRDRKKTYLWEEERMQRLRVGRRGEGLGRRGKGREGSRCSLGRRARILSKGKEAYVDVYTARATYTCDPAGTAARKSIPNVMPSCVSTLENQCTPSYRKKRPELSVKAHDAYAVFQSTQQQQRLRRLAGSDTDNSNGDNISSDTSLLSLTTSIRIGKTDRNGRTISLESVSECSKSEGPSLSTSPGSDFLTSPAHRSVPLTSRHFSRTSSRASQNSLQSPSKSTGSSPPKTGSSNSLNKFHNRLVDKLKRSLKKAEDTAEDQRNLS